MLKGNFLKLLGEYIHRTPGFRLSNSGYTFTQSNNTCWFPVFCARHWAEVILKWILIAVKIQCPFNPHSDPTRYCYYFPHFKGDEIRYREVEWLAKVTQLTRCRWGFQLRVHTLSLYDILSQVLASKDFNLLAEISKWLTLTGGLNAPIFSCKVAVHFLIAIEAHG